MDFDIFLCCAQKDYNKIKFTIEAIKRNVIGYDKICLCTPTRLGTKIDGVEQYTDREVLDINPLKFKYRPNWIYQQFLKLFQNVTTNDYYATIDTDILINKKLRFFNEEGKPIWYRGWAQNHPPYFKYQEKMFDFGKVYEHTFVADMNFFSKDIIKEMLHRYGYTFDSFLLKSIEVIDDTCYLAEPELYGSYIHKHHPGMYEYRKLKFDMKGKSQDNPKELVYTEEEMQRIVEESKNKDFDIITMHSWCWNTVNSWGF